MSFLSVPAPGRGTITGRMSRRKSGRMAVPDVPATAARVGSNMPDSRVDWDDDSVVDGMQTDAGWTISYLDVLLVMVTMFAVLLTLNFLQVEEVTPATSDIMDRTDGGRNEVGWTQVEWPQVDGTAPAVIAAIPRLAEVTSVAEKFGTGGGGNSIAPPPINLLAQTLLPMAGDSPELRPAEGFGSEGIMVEGLSLLSELADPGETHDVSVATVEPVGWRVPEASVVPEASMVPGVSGVSLVREFEQSPVDDLRTPLATELSDAVLALASRLTAEMGNRDFEVILGENQFRIELQDRILFPSGQADLNPSGLRVLADLAPWLAGSGMILTVEGHTDDRPIATARFPSNWELSSLRATTVARQLIAAGVPADRIRVMGYADTRPRVPNDSADRRALNRRVTLVVEAPIQTSGLGIPANDSREDRLEGG